MSFLDGGAFYFLFLIPLIILLYLLKLRRKPIFVSSSFLWMKAIQDARVDTPFQKLKNNILLILQILVLLILVMVKARPYVESAFSGGMHTVLLLDNSASMESTDVGKSRFFMAQKTALELIDQLREGDEMMIISVNSHPSIEVSFTGNKSKLREAVKSLEPVDKGTTMRDALVLATASLKNYGDGKIILLSDGCFGKIEGGMNFSPVTFISFGSSSDNTGITNINLRSNAFMSDEIELLVEITNFGDEKKDFLTELYTDGELFDAHRVRLDGGKKKWEVFNMEPSSGIVEVRIDVDDFLEADNEAWAIVSPPPSMKVLLVTEGNMFLEHLLSLIPDVESNIISHENYSSPEYFDLIIFDGGSISEFDKGNFMFLGTKINSSAIKFRGEAEKPVIVSWDREHPVMRFVDFSDIHVAKAFSVEINKGKSLVDSKETSLMSVLVDKNFKALFIGFSLYDSDILLRPAFPVMFFNALQWFNPASFEISSRQIKTGEPIKISNSSNIKIIAPDGKKTNLSDDGEKGDLIFSGTDIAGIYVLEKDKDKEYMAINLFDEEESDIKPSKVISIGKSGLEASKTDEVVQKEFWKVFAFIVLFLLLIEWYLFHKRIT